MKKTIGIWLLLLALTGSAQAQTEPEYRLEVGGGVGAVTYQGDFNSSLFKDIQPMGSLLAKYRFDPRRALALNISYGQVLLPHHLGLHLQDQHSGCGAEIRI